MGTRPSWDQFSSPSTGQLKAFNYCLTRPCTGQAPILAVCNSRGPTGTSSMGVPVPANSRALPSNPGSASGGHLHLQPWHPRDTSLHLQTHDKALEVPR